MQSALVRSFGALRQPRDDTLFFCAGSREKISIDFQRLTRNVIGSRADGEGPRRRSNASALGHPSTSSHASFLRVMQSALVRSFSVLRQPQDDTRSGASNAGLLSGKATLNRYQAAAGLTPP